MSWRTFIVALALCFAAVVCSAAQMDSPDANIKSSEHAPASSGMDLDMASSTSTITVAELTVPTKARKELEKARKAAVRHRMEEADHHIAKALLAWPRYCQALTLKSWLELRRHSYEEARVDAEMAVEDDPHDHLALVTLGDSYLFLHRLDDALRAFDRSIAVKPNAWQGYYAKGKLAILLGDWPGALRAAAKASSLTGENAYLHLLRAFALAGMKDRPAADNEIAAFRRLKPEAASSPQIKRALNDLGIYDTEPTRDVTRGDSTLVTHP
jgi:tetratricopeptide (TPR) repeat protein